MKEEFGQSSNPARLEPDPAEQILKDLGCHYIRRPNGTLLVQGDIDLSNRNLTALPDLSSVFVSGNFRCHDNHLHSLRGAPSSVGGDFACYRNNLTSLEYAPRSVGGSFMCQQNNLTSLKHAPAQLGGNFWCYNNQLTSLEGAPPAVSGDFLCHNNQLASLKYAPQFVSADFMCHNNRLASLEHAPASVGGSFWCYNNREASLSGHVPLVFQRLQCDLGDFSTWDDLAKRLQIPTDTKERLVQKREIILAQGATVLQRPITPFPRLVLKIAARA
jgi:hypothetical protein